jgi:hypothetical protein
MADLAAFLNGRSATKISYNFRLNKQLFLLLLLGLNGRFLDAICHLANKIQPSKDLLLI